MSMAKAMRGKSEIETPDEHKPAEEREGGPWDRWDLEGAAEHLTKADKIGKNKKFLEAIKKHAESKAAEHHKVANRAAMLARSGHISEKQMEKIEKR